MKKVVYGILVFLYVLVSVFVTTCLLSFNDHRVSVIGNSSLIIVNSKNKIADYKNGTLLVVKKDISKIENNQEILYYDVYDNEVSIKTANVINIEHITANESTLTIDNNKSLSSEYVIGKLSDTQKYPILGSVLEVLESRWGYLIIIILPILIVFIYEILELVKEIKPKENIKKIGIKNEKKIAKK